MRNWAIFWEFTKQSMKISLQQPVGAVFFVIGKLLRFIMFGIFVYFLLSGTNVLAGYNLQQTLIFFLTFNIVDGITQFLFRQVYRFRPLILSGDFDLVLVKPMHPFLRVLIGGVDILDIIPLSIFTGLLIWLLSMTSGITAGGIILYLLLILNALLIATGFHIFVLAMGIVSTEVDHTIMIYRDISRMGSFPVDIYTQPIRAVLTFVIPIGVMITFPVQALIGILQPAFVLISFGIGIAFVSLSLWAWNRALLAYQSASS